MNESFVQVAPDSTGKAIDAVAIVNPATGTTQYRQTTTLGDPNQPGSVQGVFGGGDAQTRDSVVVDLLSQILIELRVMNTILQTTLNSRDDLDALRASEATQPQQTTA